MVCCWWIVLISFQTLLEVLVAELARRLFDDSGRDMAFTTGEFVAPENGFERSLETEGHPNPADEEFMSLSNAVERSHWFCTADD